jgi:hypothetical protein
MVVVVVLTLSPHPDPSGPISSSGVRRTAFVHRTKVPAHPPLDCLRAANVCRCVKFLVVVIVIVFAWIVDYDNDNDNDNENGNGIEISSTVCSKFAE